MDIERFNISKFTLSNENREFLSVKVIEKDGCLEDIEFSQPSLTHSMNFSELVKFSDFLQKIIQYVRKNYAQLSGDLCIDTGDSILNPSRSAAQGILPITADEELDIPEVFVFTKMGMCLFHFNTVGEISERKIPEQLVSGLMSAINDFAMNMGWADGISLIKSGNTEVRFSGGNYILVALVSTVNTHFSHLIEPILQDLAKDLVKKFERDYHMSLKTHFEGEITDIGIFGEFISDIEDFLIKYRKQTFEVYQKLILAEAMQLEIPHDRCISLIQKVSGGTSVIGELGDMMQDYPILKDAIKKVNYDQFAMWKIFGTPIYQV